MKGSRKTTIFKLTAILLPFLFLLLLEFALRITGYGHDLSLFIKDDSCADCLAMNPFVSERYFTNGANATIGNTEPFRAKKAKGTIRLFVLGESTTIGYPYMHNGSFHRWLKYRLIQMYPDLDFEIINLSLTAVNSYTVLDMAREIDQYEPDAVLIYSGHNEYYGALGVGSTSRMANSSTGIRLLIRLRQWRIIQLMASVKHLFGEGKTDTSKTLMERMAADQHIIYGSEKFTIGVNQFKQNINDVCRVLSEKKIPVFISTLVSNEKDVSPFVSSHQKNISADVEFRNGIMAYNQQDSVQAKTFFVKAKDFDELRFRAPTQMNLIIETAAKEKHPGVYLVDSRRLFEQASHYGILDHHTLLEHVHPNLLGYSILSEAFFQSLMVHHILPAAQGNTMQLVQLQRQMPITTVDSLFGAYSILLLKKGWPYYQSSLSLPKAISTEECIAEDMLVKKLPWNEAMDRLISYYQQNNTSEKSLKVAEAVMLEYPMDPTFYAYAGRMCHQQREIPKAINYLHRAFVLKPSMSLARELFSLELSYGRLEKAITYIDFALVSHPENMGLKRLRLTVSNIIDLQNAVKNDPVNLNLQTKLKKAYASLKLEDESSSNNRQ